jgi:hypothetical protein
VAVTTVVFGTPSIAYAAGINGSGVNFNTANNNGDFYSGIWTGPATGHAKPCGEVYGGQSDNKDLYEIWRDIDFLPDIKITGFSNPHNAYWKCGSYGSTSNNHYTKVVTSIELPVKSGHTGSYN